MKNKNEIYPQTLKELAWFGLCGLAQAAQAVGGAEEALEILETVEMVVMNTTAVIDQVVDSKTIYLLKTMKFEKHLVEHGILLSRRLSIEVGWKPQVFWAPFSSAL